MRQRFDFCARQFRRSLHWISDAGGHFALDSFVPMMSAEGALLCSNYIHALRGSSKVSP